MLLTAVTYHPHKITKDYENHFVIINTEIILSIDTTRPNHFRINRTAIVMGILLAQKVTSSIYIYGALFQVAGTIPDPPVDTLLQINAKENSL